MSVLSSFYCMPTYGVVGQRRVLWCSELLFFKSSFLTKLCLPLSVPPQCYAVQRKLLGKTCSVLSYFYWPTSSGLRNVELCLAWLRPAKTCQCFSRKPAQSFVVSNQETPTVFKVTKVHGRSAWMDGWWDKFESGTEMQSCPSCFPQKIADWFWSRTLRLQCWEYSRKN